jgi:uncharacterized protein involved in outer membrane biogenesis
MKNAVRAAVMAVLVLAIVAVGAVSLFLGRIVKTAVETAGPRVLGAPVTLASATILPWSGRGTLRGLTIGNPPGFRGAAALKVGEVSVRVKPSSLFSDTVVVESVVVRGPEILYEYGPGGSNLAALQRRAQGASAAPREPAKAGPGSGKALFIRDLRLTGGRVGLQGQEIALPDVHLTDLGGPGQPPAKAAAQALSQVSAAAGRAAAGVGARALQGAAQSALGAFLKGLKK